MELIKKNYLDSKNFILKPTSESSLLAKEISFSYGLYVGRVMSMIKKNGIQCIRECFNESKKAPNQPAIGLFIWLVKKNSTPLEEVKTEKIEKPKKERSNWDYSYSISCNILRGQGRTEQQIVSLIGTNECYVPPRA